MWQYLFVPRLSQFKPEDILKASMTLFFAEGVGISTAKIAAAAGVSNGTLFNYFPTKQELIDVLYVSIKTDLGSAIGDFDVNAPLEKRMRQVWDRWLGWQRSHRIDYSVAKLLIQSGLASSAAQELGDSAMARPAQILVEAKQRGLLTDLPLDFIAALIQHHLEQTVAFDLDADHSDLAYRALWNCITQT